MKVNSVMGLIQRVFSVLEPNTFRKLYAAFVRSHIDYCQAVWFTHSRVSLAREIENVQIGATKAVDRFSDLDYTDRLKFLKLTRIWYRHYKGDMIEIYKHFHVYDANCISDSFTRQTRTSHKDGIRGIQANSFYYRAARLWNLLPGKVVSAKTMNTFKNRLNEHWSNASFMYEFGVPPPELEGLLKVSD